MTVFPPFLALLQRELGLLWSSTFFSLPLSTYRAWADVVGDIAMTANTQVLVMRQGAVLWVLVVHGPL